MFDRLRTYASFVRISHSVFALPFALVGALLATQVEPWSWTRGLWIVVCMVTARSAAMGFNRLADVAYDARNPRTAMRELPQGRMSRCEAIIFVVVSSVAFVYASSHLGWICFALSPVALVIVFFYSCAKRFTSYAQLFLGLAMAVAPVGGWLAAGGREGWEPWLLGLAICAWVGVVWWLGISFIFIVPGVRCSLLIRVQQGLQPCAGMALPRWMQAMFRDRLLRSCLGFQGRIFL